MSKDKAKKSGKNNTPTYDSLKHSHKLFVDHYLKTGNITKAYRSVYPENKNPDASGARLAGNDKIKEAVEERKAQLYADLNITEEDLKRVWKEILNDPDAKASDKLNCSQIVGKYLGIFRDTPQVAVFQQLRQDDMEKIEQDTDDIIDVEHKIEE